MRKCRGFTLVELLIVVAILAMLLGMLMPTLQRAIEIAEDVMCKTNLNAIRQALSMYAKDHDGYLPSNGYPNDGTYYWETWNNMLTTGYGPNRYGWMPTTSYIPKSGFECPSYGWDYTRRGAYGLNFAMAGYDSEGDGNYVRYEWPNRQYRLDATVRPSRMYLSGDTGKNEQGSQLANFAVWGSFSTPAYRHLGHCNVAFHDGHVEPLTNYEIPVHVWFYLPWFNREEYAW